MKKLLFFLLVLLLFNYGVAQEKSSITFQVEKLAQRFAALFLKKAKNKFQNNVAVMPFKEIGPEVKEKEIGKVVAAVMETELRKTGVFDVIDRDNLNRAMDEIALGLSGVTENSDELEIGKIMAANFFLSGNITELEGLYIINVKLTSVKTSSVILTEKIEFSKNKMNSMAVMMLTEKKYPVIAGFQSALIPGWGQFYNDQPVNGKITLTLAIATGGFSIANKILMTISKNKGDALRQEYDNWPTWSYTSQAELDENREKAEQLYTDAEEEYKKAEGKGTLCTVGLIGYGAVWLYSVVQSIGKAGKTLRDIQKAQEELQAGNNSGRLDSLSVVPYYDPLNDETGLRLALRF